MKKVRLDKAVSTALVISRKDASLFIKQGKVSVNGKPVRLTDLQIDPETDSIKVGDKEIAYREFIYLVMNKPQGLVSSTEDKREKTVLSLLPESYAEKGVFPAGRLDKDTVGLLVLTNDGALAHSLLSPKFHAEKRYAVECDGDFTEEDIKKMQKGFTLDGKLTKPAHLVIDLAQKNRGIITLTEGKYHQIKRMCEVCGKTVTFLERIEFGGIHLDPNLPRGEWREMTGEEIAVLKGNAGG